MPARSCGLVPHLCCSLARPEGGDSGALAGSRPEPQTRWGKEGRFGQALALPLSHGALTSPRVGLFSAHPHGTLGEHGTHRRKTKRPSTAENALGAPASPSPWPCLLPSSDLHHLISPVSSLPGRRGTGAQGGQALTGSHLVRVGAGWGIGLFPEPAVPFLLSCLLGVPSGVPAAWGTGAQVQAAPCSLGCGPDARSAFF